MCNIFQKGEIMILGSRKYRVVLPALLVFACLGTVKEAYAEEIRYTTTANLNMRTGVGTHNRILLTIPKGRQITYVASKNGWYQVRYGGRDGYVSSAYVKKTVAASSSPVSSTPISGAGQVKTTGALNFRTGPDKTYARVGTMPKNTTVSYSEIKNGWYLITYNGKTGYASGRYLTVLSQTATEPSSPTPAPPTMIDPPAETTGETVSGKRYFTTTSLNMRTGPSTAYSIVQVLPSGAELTYHGQNGWYHVSYNGKTGYASNRYVRVEEAAPEPSTGTVPAPVEETVEAETPPVKLPEVSEPEVEIPEVTGVLVKTELLYTTTTLNMRTGPGTGNSILLTLPKGVHLRSEGVENGWHKLTYAGKTGYASGKYLAAHSAYTVDGTILVNKGLPLPSGFNPGENPEARAAFNRMNQAAKRQGIRLNLFSGFRSYSYQKSLYNRYVREDGKALAETYSARPGFSEHQTGLTFDIGGADSSKWTSSKFGATREGIWLVQNAPDYGFILRYPEGKQHITGYVYEPWHFRYVGVDLAKKVTASGLTLDEYFQEVHPEYK
ncbi:MAG: hypothetical protein EOM07_05465 [Clostridia bacterium]|nr:hypothetical protein [Clostridia bacterium]